MIKLNELFDQISIDDQKIVVELVNEFELLWLKTNSTNSSQKPDIDSVLQQAKQRCSSKMAVQSALTQFLLLDMDYRIDRNETPRPEDYLQQFPSEEAIIHHCFQIQQVDGNYQRIGRLAEGGLGVVNIAHDRSLNRRVAYKELRDVYAHDPSKQARFKREAEITGRLQHPGIVSIYNFEESWDGSARYVMPLIEGEQFATAIERFHSRRISGQSPVIDRTELRKLLKSYVVACQTVAYAHSQNIVHRDIKPQNILLGKFGETIIVDWGLAKCIVEPEPSSALKSGDPAINDTLVDAADVTQTGEVFGTPMFMSPEQASASLGLVGPKSDIYSLGVTLYFLLTGQLPFKGEKVDEILSAIIKGEFRKPREVLAQIPPALEAICLKCMSHTPSERYENAMQLALDVDNWMANEQVCAYSEPRFEKLTRLVRRYPTWSGVSAVATALVLIGLSIIVGLTMASNRKLSRAIDTAKQESNRLEEMQRFFVKELKAASPSKDQGTERVETISQLLEHMLTGVESFRERDEVTYAKLLGEISEICYDRSEFNAAGTGFEKLVRFVSERREKGINDDYFRDLRVPSILRLAHSYNSYPDRRFRVASVLADIDKNDLTNDQDRELYGDSVGWAMAYQHRFDEALSLSMILPPGSSVRLDRLRAFVLSQHGKFDESFEILERLFETLPDSEIRSQIMIGHTLSEVRAQAGQYDEAIRTQRRVCEMAEKVYSGHDLHLFLAKIQLMEFNFVLGDYPECRKLAMECMSTIDEAPKDTDVWKHRPTLELRIAGLNLADPSSIFSQLDFEKTVQQLIQLELVYEYLYERDLVCFLYCRLLNKEELAAQMIESSKELFSDARPGHRKNFAYRNMRMAKASQFRNLTRDLQDFIAEIELCVRDVLPNTGAAITK